ncbi:unnamed protein product [Cylicostephanus goldi]|uniref:Uncharacterized protein n=1 Tax=Cylicostephanus goldi TaxID=71465 RepID=A0A3P6SRU7_CYLGO|nr:unnamed protein product [Cylicostephanus goldi]
MEKHYEEVYVKKNYISASSNSSSSERVQHPRGGQSVPDVLLHHPGLHPRRLVLLHPQTRRAHHRVNTAPVFRSSHPNSLPSQAASAAGKRTLFSLYVDQFTIVHKDISSTPSHFALTLLFVVIPLVLFY